MRFRFLPSILLLVAVSSTARAASITYDVNLSVSGATATGTITTDGTTGLLTLANITGYSLTLNDGSNSTLIDYTGNAPLDTNDGDGYLTASTTGLFVNGVAGANDALSFNDSSFMNALCFTSDAAYCTNKPVSGPVFVITSNGVDYVESLTGLQQFASVPNATPEPSSLWLLGTGAIGMVGAMRRRFV